MIAAGRFHPESPAGALTPRIWCSEHSNDVPNDTFISISSRTCDTENEVMFQ